MAKIAEADVPLPELLPYLKRAVFSSQARDWAAKLGAGCCFLFLAFAMGIRCLTTLRGAHSFDAVTLAQILSSCFLMLFYILIVWLTFIRGRALKRAAGIQPRASAILGTFLSLSLGFFPIHTDLPLSWYVVSAALLLLGSASVLLVLPRLGRSFSLMAEARDLVTSGPYSVIRHPLYLAEEIAVIGGFIPVASVATLLILLSQFGFQILRMRNEEAILARAFPAYAAYKARTARLIPGIW